MVKAPSRGISLAEFPSRNSPRGIPLAAFSQTRQTLPHTMGNSDRAAHARIDLPRLELREFYYLSKNLRSHGEGRVVKSASIVKAALSFDMPLRCRSQAIAYPRLENREPLRS